MQAQSGEGGHAANTQGHANMSCAVSEQVVEPVQHRCPRRPWGRWALQAGLWVLFANLMLSLFWEGFDLRRMAFDLTAPIRFRGDISRNYSLGKESLQMGYLNIYENHIAEKRPDVAKINYTPLRLGVFHAWVAWNQAHLTPWENWRPDYEFTSFLMVFNTVVELLAAVAAFLLVRHWVRRTWRAPQDALPLEQRARPGPWAGITRATIAFTLVWLSPGLIIMGHGWPSPNAWVPAFFLWTVLLCSWERWFAAGLVLGAGAMFQGQQLFVAPMFILWPLFAGQPGRALRWVAGFGFAFMMIASGWMLTIRPNLSAPERVINHDAVNWIVVSALLMAVVALRPRRREVLPEARRQSNDPLSRALRPLRQAYAAIRALAIRVMCLQAGQNRWKHPLTWVSLAAAVGAVLLVTAPLRNAGIAPVLSVILTAAGVILVWFARRRVAIYVVAGLVATQLLLCVKLYGASTAWWELGFMYGTERHQNMAVGTCNNLCSLLYHYGWTDVKQVMQTIPAGFLLGWPAQDRDVTLTEQMLAIYALCLVVSCIALAIQWRRKDRNFLIAMITPWVLFYTIPAQIHERYIVFAATAAACAIGASVGMTLIGVFFVALTYIQTSHCMMQANHIIPGGMDLDHPYFNARIAGYYMLLRPDISYAVVLACIIFLYASFLKYRKRAKVPQLAIAVPPEAPPQA